MGIELNHDKRELPTQTTRHLGFNIDLLSQMVAITVKHRNRIISFFNMMMAAARGNGRIPVSRMQKNLGLQILVSTVFRVSRQFLTSTCDILRKLLPLQLKYFYSRKKPALLTRFIADLQFWRRFTVASPQCSFKFFARLDAL